MTVALQQVVQEATDASSDMCKTAALGTNLEFLS